jgi:chromosomal replication initiation ATPase DnaA
MSNEKNKGDGTEGSSSASPYAYPGILQKEKLTLSALERVVCNALGVKPSLLYIRTRQRKVCFPRQVLFYFAVKHKDSLPFGEGMMDSIGGRYGRHHATVHYAAATLLPNLLATNREVRELCAKIAEAIPQRFTL